MDIVLLGDEHVDTVGIERLLSNAYLNVLPGNYHAGSIHFPNSNDHDLIIFAAGKDPAHTIDFIKSLRGARIEEPILILAEAADTHAKIKSLASGADDCLSGPFQQEELVARVMAL